VSGAVREMRVSVNKKIILALILVLGLGPVAALAEEGKKKDGISISEWLKGLQNRIAQIVPRKTITMSTAVAGIRGAKEDSTTRLYWKGKKSEEAVAEEELALFKEGIELVAKGDRSMAIKELETFMATYPLSSLIPDAKKALDLVNAEPKAEERVEQKPAAEEVKTVETKEEKKEDKQEEAKKAE
jgi:hypothetical protein